MIKFINQADKEGPTVTMTTVEAADLSDADRVQLASRKLNYAWFDAHAVEIYEANRGKWICVAGQELFSADALGEVTALAKAEHPQETGSITRYIRPKEAIRTHVNGYRIEKR